jgi:hypothetical protein
MVEQDATRQWDSSVLQKATKENPMSVCSEKGIDRWLVT